VYANKQLRILVVDDAPDTVTSLALLLGRCGHHVYTTMSSLAALELLKIFPIDVVLLDFLMPEADGFSVARRLPGSAHRPAIIGISGDLDAANAAAASGIEYFLTKPVKFSELQDLLGRIGGPSRPAGAH
jgi:CheY-like chemotaxis protein